MLAHLADVSIRSLLVALSAAIVLWMLRSRRTAALQHAVWTAVVCGMLALLAFGATLPRLPLQVLESPAPPAKAAEAPPVSSSVSSYGDPVEPALDLPVPAPAARRVDWSRIAAYAYAAIALGLLARFITGIFLVRRLLAKSISVGGFRESSNIAVPLTVGWLHPEILLPFEWREWSREKLDAVLAHEGAHVRRHDGLVAALAGINRCIFWFHPLAWILERKLRLLAELACDESCVATLGDRERYARLLLDMARVVDGAHGRLQSHALTMAAGSHIRQRIDSLLQEGRTFSRGLTWSGWAAVALCGIPVVLGAGSVTLDRQAPLLQLAMPRVPVPTPPASSQVTLAQARPTPPTPTPAAPPRFEVASIRPGCAVDNDGGRGGKGGGGGRRVRWSPGRLDVECATVASLIRDAYLAYPDGQPWPVLAIGARIPAISMRILNQPITGSPAWLNSDRYNIQATAEGAPTEEMAKGPMMQALLEDRFKLRIHRETREIPVYELAVATGGPKLKRAQPGSCIADRTLQPPAPDPAPGQPFPPASEMPCGLFLPSRGNDGTDVNGTTIANLARSFSIIFDRDVIDKTGISGMFDIHFDSPDRDPASPPPGAPGAGAPGPNEVIPPGALTDADRSTALAAFQTAIQKLGLKLEPAKGSGEFLVIDHVEKPSEN